MKILSVIKKQKNSFAFWNKFKKHDKNTLVKRDTEIRDEIIERSNEQKLQTERDLTQAEKYYLELRQQREQLELEKLKDQQELEEANNAYYREQETTIQQLDYKSIILNNINILPQDDFKNLDEFLHYAMKFNFEYTQLTEDNFQKVLKGFNYYSKDIDEELIKGPYFDMFLEYIIKYVPNFNQTETLTELFKFLDIYCVNLPELWSKSLRQLDKYLYDFNIDQMIDIITSLGNQGEGNESTYDQIEKRLENELKYLTFAQQIQVLKVYFNFKAGTEYFIKKLLDLILENIKDPYLQLNVEEIKNFVLIINYLKEDFIKDQQIEIFKQTELCILRIRNHINFKITCQIAFGFGSDFGSQNLFKFLHQQIKYELNNLNQQQFEEYLKGFIFTYRIQPDELIQFLNKYEGFLSGLNPTNLAKLNKTLYMYDLEKSKYIRIIEVLLIQFLKFKSKEFTQEDLYQIILSYTMTRLGSREFHKILEFNLPTIIEKYKFDQEYIEEINSMLTESGMTSFEVIQQLSKFEMKSEQLILITQLKNITD